MSIRCRMRCLAAVLALLAVIGAASAAMLWLTETDPSTLTDAEKLERVYAMYEDYRREFPSVPDISPAEVMRRVQGGEKVTLVDVREKREMDVSIIPGAVAEREVRSDPARFKDGLVVGYCTISYRSGKLARSFERLGLRYANLRGGVLAWVLEGGGLVTPDGEPTRRIHVYGRDWNYPAAGYEAVW